MKKSRRDPNESSGDVESLSRSTFTRGWEKALDISEGLPVKQGGKVIRQIKMDVQDNGGDVESEDDESNYNDEPAMPIAEPSEYSSFDKPIKPKPSKKHVQPIRTLAEFQLKLGSICTDITTDPERSMKSKRQDLDGKTFFGLSDLFELLKHDNSEYLEMAMLSALLVFKNILPGYKIRDKYDEESDSAVSLKKETKKIREYERALLAAYQKFIAFLEDKIKSGLGSTRSLLQEWDGAVRLGFSALRCECELLKWLPHFNFRIVLITTIVNRATQPCLQISDMCSNSLEYLFQNDHEGEMTLEAVKLMAKTLTASKYDVPEKMLTCLRLVKMTIRADDAKDIKRKVKQEKRKRKRQHDEVDVGLLESSAVSDQILVKKNQAGCLHEVTMIYFRAIKQKIGFKLLPIALEGLGRMTHLINIDTVEDLITLLRNIIEAHPAPPVDVKIRCIQCALRTLSGPGQELNIDDETFVCALRKLIAEDLPSEYCRWDIILECVELCFISKREARNHVVISYVRTMLLSVCHMTDSSCGATILAVVHAILMRYPRARQDITALAFTVQREEDEVGDLAMKALKDTNNRDESVGGDWSDNLTLGDGSWILAVFRLHKDSRYSKVVAAMLSRDVMPVPYRISDAWVKDIEDEKRQHQVLDKIDASLQQLPNKIPKGAGHTPTATAIKKKPKLCAKGVDDECSAILAVAATKYDTNSLTAQLQARFEFIKA